MISMFNAGLHELNHYGQCKICRSLLRKKHNDKNRPSRRNWELKNSFGITTEDYNNLLISQDGVCKICKLPERVKTKKRTLKSLAVDHCHETKKVKLRFIAND